MNEYVLIERKANKYLCKGEFKGTHKSDATKFDKDKADKLKKAFNTLTKRLNVDIEKA